MIKLLVIADDLTGAMDTGVQFAKQHIPTLVTCDSDISFDVVSPEIQVLSVNTESRHDAAQTAYEKVSHVVNNALEYKIKYIYKKTDSALRGNIGAEIEAVFKAAGAQQLSFLPAYPATGRTTTGGRQYIDGTPLEETAFGRDMLSPVETSVIEDIIRKQSSVAVLNVPAGGNSGNFSGICVYDAASNDDMKRVAAELRAKGKLDAMAGCAGFAALLPALLRLEAKSETQAATGETMLIVSGSLNETTRKQIRHARSIGVPVFTVPEGLLLCGRLDMEHTGRFTGQVANAIKTSGVAVIDAAGDTEQVERARDSAGKRGFDERRLLISKNLGRLACRVLAETQADTLTVFGGDTLAGVMEQMGISGIIPEDEITDGVVFGRMEKSGRNIVTKSGGFGREDCIDTIIRYFSRKR